MITSDAQLLVVIFLLLAAMFYTSKLTHWMWRYFYTVMPFIMACYFLPSLLNLFDLIHIQDSKLADYSSNILMPTCMILLLLGLNVEQLFKYGRLLLLLFLIGSVGVLLGGPFALWALGQLNSTLLIANDNNAVWLGMTTLAGNWVGGTANQLAMKDLFKVGDNIFGVFVAVNVIVSGIWMAILMALVPYEMRINTWLKSKEPPFVHQSLVSTKLPARPWYISVSLLLFALALSMLAHVLSFYTVAWIDGLWPSAENYHLNSKDFWLLFWLMLLGVLSSLSPMTRLRCQGSEQLCNLCLYLMLAIMGLRIDLFSLFALPWCLALGVVWLMVHIVLLMLVTKLLRLPFSYFAIASQCNLGGAVSAPILAKAYRADLAPVAVLITIFAYLWANIVALSCGQLMLSLVYSPK